MCLCRGLFPRMLSDYFTVVVCAMISAHLYNITEIIRCIDVLLQSAYLKRPGT